MFQNPSSPVMVRWLLPATAGIAAWMLGQWIPLASPLLIGLVLGVIVVNSPAGRLRIFAGHQTVTKTLLRLGVVLLGLRLSLGDIMALGPRVLVIIAVAVAVTFIATSLIGDRLGLDRGLVTMIAVGFSICGAAAIAAVEGGIKRKNEDVAVAIAMVTLFGTAMIVLLPLASGMLGLSSTQLGVWAGASIHEVAQVVAAATTAGAAAVAIAMTVKLGRVSLLAVAYVAARRRHGGQPVDGARPPVIPWFVVGFMVSAAVATLRILPEPVVHVADFATTILLASAMFGLGLGMHLRSLFPVSFRVLGLSAASTGIAASVSLILTMTLF
ncbi:YeiH family protein [Paenarthrobacter ureafaciens]|uniref:YeiH family protein n=1 Tax=Paenarthrobacter ureafaciens TaxID=37931 RepID=UPI002DB93B79|nr:putative sulfate exporter family transporter [Paenarthrobacter ureafaciens]MEC3854102.1 putative sulfate exporter family transporter [Paenarthrobacter ureafaciens]